MIAVHVSGHRNIARKSPLLRIERRASIGVHTAAYHDARKGNDVPGAIHRAPDSKIGVAITIIISRLDNAIIHTCQQGKIQYRTRSPLGWLLWTMYHKLSALS